MSETKGFVVPAGGGTPLDMAAPGRFAALKLLGHETNGSIMMFEETLPPGTKSLFHLHHDSDEVAWVLAGEITVLIGEQVSVAGPGTCAFFPRGVQHAWKNSGNETGRVLFLYTPAGENFPPQLAGLLLAIVGMVVGSLGPQAIRNIHGSHHHLVGVPEGAKAGG